jgi:hypothetical protein
MLSEHELRVLDRLGRELEEDAPRLIKRLRRFGRGWLIRRLSAAVVGSAAGIGFIVAALAMAVGWSTWAFGVTLLIVCGWEAARRARQLHDLRPGVDGAATAPGWRRPPDERPERLC